MSDLEQSPTSERLTELLEQDPKKAAAYLDRFDTADAETRKQALQAVRNFAMGSSDFIGEFTESLATFLTDDNRAVRLTAAKLFVALAESEPAATVSAVDALAERLGDADEFYYVRARSAEALGYLALDSPESVTDPEILADLRIGLEFDDTEVKEKLAKALAYVALGDPKRLRHHADSLAEHLADENELVRYHLTTALVVVGSVSPETLAEVSDPLEGRLNDTNPYVRGRAAEALGLLAASGASVRSERELSGVTRGDDSPSFLTDRVAFCRAQRTTTASVDAPDGIGTIESVRAGTDDVVEEMATPADGVCSHCGLELSEIGPPMCPRCGAPR